MKTRSFVFIGLVVLFGIFGISSYLQWECAQEIKKVSEYHKNMSIPAISLLNQIQLNFENMHIASVEEVESNKVITHVEKHFSYQQNKDDLIDNIEKYDFLSKAKNSHDEFHANEMMQREMENYAHFYREIINSNDVVMEQFENGELSTLNAISQLQSIEDDFHKNLEKNIEMEIKGMEKTQAKIGEIEKQMEMIFFTSGIIAVVSTILIIIFTTRFVTNPISKLVEVTKEIGKGKTIKLDENSNNSDVNNVLIAFNQMSNDLQEYREKMSKQEKLSTIGELSSRLAHDIRNPLTIIKASMDIMKLKKDLSQEDLDKFQRVDSAIYRITHQIDNVLDFVKGKPLKISKYPVQEIFNSVKKDLPTSKNIKFVDQNLEISCDFELIKVVMINLIVNANHAIENQGKIKITSEKIDNKIIFQVEDNGPGIPEDQFEKIFEPLYTTKQEGTGLGLASCKSIVEKHGGTISVKNNPTRFIIEIPQSN